MSDEPIDTARHAEASRLLGKGLRLCRLHLNSKQPVGDDWQRCPVEYIDQGAGGYGLMLAANGLCSIDPDHGDLAVEGVRRCGYDLEQWLDAGVRTLSTRPGSGGRSTFRVPPGTDLRWIRFASRAQGSVLELRAHSSNLQDCLPGTVYMTPTGGPYQQRYGGPLRLDEAPELPTALLKWWSRLSADFEFLHTEHRKFLGEEAVLPISGNFGGRSTLAFASPLRMDFNSAHRVEDILRLHGYRSDDRGRWSPPQATGAPGIRPIPGSSGLWQSDHASDVLHGTFDAWAAYVSLDHTGDVAKAEDAWAPQRALRLVEGFQPVPETPGSASPAFRRCMKTGAILASKTNLALALRASAVIERELRYDTFRGEIMVAPHQTDEWRPFDDNDYVAICLALEGRGFKNIGRELIRDMVSYVADENRFDTAQHWLNGLVWDGESRIDTFFHRYFSVADSLYSRAVSRYLWSALAGRILVPGVKCDMVSVLVGAQGLRKSTAVAAIVPAAQFFTTIDLSRKDDDLARVMKGKLVIELDELKGLATREAEHIKAFLTRTGEEWTPKYREMATRYARRCIFIGTSNRDDFLVDDTGHRRWLPLTCGVCDPVGIARVRDQLWAEARDLFALSGVVHAEAEQLARAEHERFLEADDWDEVVREWLQKSEDFGRAPPSSRAHLTSREVLYGALKIEPANQNRMNQSRVKRVLTRLGYRYTNKRVDGVRMRVFEPPSLF